MTLRELADTDREITRQRSRKAGLNKLLPNDAQVEMVRSGGYQGTLYIVVKHGESYYLLNDHYGSCTGCDLYMSDPEKWVKNVLTDSKKFETRLEAVKYLLDEESHGWSWSVADTDKVVEKLYRFNKGKENE